MSTVADKLILKRKETSLRKEAEKIEEQDDKEILSKNVWFWSLLDFDKLQNIAWLIVLRLLEACTLTWNVGHADQFW